MDDNFESFNQVVGLIFDQLYRAFPIAVQIDYDRIAERLDIPILLYEPPSGLITTRTRTYGPIAQSDDMEVFVDEAVAFLSSEGFIQAEGRNYLRLSAKALALLNAPLSGLEKPAGTRIVEISRGAATEAGRAALSEVVGQVIGAAAKGFFGG